MSGEGSDIRAEITELFDGGYVVHMFTDGRPWSDSTRFVDTLDDARKIAKAWVDKETARENFRGHREIVRAD